ncbi:hypothetical protein [Marinobacterium sedimentorum]|uniref:hypothetical protein n=1 Tax=Marinobacterium sedimentorum TaxID=2927804 RepID=UPI0020C5D702|nr:hypothetical protein [Marinobacterium sedimentorum]MCP8687160.1 hypothetical protein [Marinobacterium sedimentorum]
MLKNLKAQNVAPLGLLVLSSLLLAVILTYGVDELPELKHVIAELGGLAAITALSVLLTYLLPANMKHCLIYLRFSNALPAHRFCRLMAFDPRVDQLRLKALLPDLPTLADEGTAQNIYWYRHIYQPVRDAELVKGVHKAFLLYRDTATALLVIALLLNVSNLAEAWFLFQSMQVSMGFLIVIYVEALLMGLAAHNCGNRFVTTAVTEFVMQHCSVPSD